MLIDPYTGEQFIYEKQGDHITLASKQENKTITYLDI